MFRKLAPRAGVRVRLEPKYGSVGQIEFRDGRKRYFRGSQFDLNLLGSAVVAQDKDYTNYFLGRMGYPAAPGKAFYGGRWKRPGRDIRAAYRYAKKIGFPVFVKPNGMAQGHGVAKVFTKTEFERAVRSILRKDEIFLVQRPLEGRDYRLLVLDRKVVSAYERFPLSIVGDGRRSVKALLERKRREFLRKRHETIPPAHDFRIRGNLARRGLTLRAVIPKGERLFLLSNANLSTGGEAVDVTDRVHPAFRKIAVAVARDTGLRYCGVDVIVRGSISRPPGQYWILEVNAAPGIEYYASKGKTHAKRVEGVYLKILRLMKRP